MTTRLESFRPLEINGQIALTATEFLAAAPELAAYYQPADIAALWNHLEVTRYPERLTSDIIKAHYTWHATLDAVARELGVLTHRDQLTTLDKGILPYLLRETYGEELGDWVWGTIYLRELVRGEATIYWLWIPPATDRAINAQARHTVWRCSEIIAWLGTYLPTGYSTSRQILAQK